MEVARYVGYCTFCNCNVMGSGMEQHLSVCEENPENIIVPCDYCKEYFSLKEMEKHIEVCNANPKNIGIPCEICNKNISPDEYEHHFQVCEQETQKLKEILCEFCNVKFNGIEQYEAHLAMCTQEPKINCDYCQMDFEIDDYDNHINACKRRFDMEKAEKESNQECPICLLNFEGKQVLPLLCLHKFHEDCILDWCKKQKVCPICQREISEPELA